MPPQELLLWVFCLVDDELTALNLTNPRSRGPAPTLTDAEVITIELVGEFWGLDAAKPLYRHFRPSHLPRAPPRRVPQLGEGPPASLRPPGRQPVGRQAGAPPPPGRPADRRA